jgi:ribosomal protein S18 acetylase RimI-like enzyme
MLYLERPMGGPPPPSDGLPPLTWRAYATDTESDFERVIAQTYSDSRDCPEICGLRPVSAAIASHKAGGVFRAEHWELALLAGEPAGCVLVSEMPHARLAELVYMGVAPALRGQGVGRALLRRAWEHAQQLRVRQLTLVVDERNAAARRLYERFGMREFSRRGAWLRVASSAVR